MLEKTYEVVARIPNETELEGEIDIYRVYDERSGDREYTPGSWGNVDRVNNMGTMGVGQG